MNERSYDDIIDMQRPEPERHPRMRREARAAQFAPFSALVGFEDAIAETARLTMREVELCDDMKEKLDRWHTVLMAIVDAKPMIEITYFIPDKRKRGGRYMTHRGRLMRYDSTSGTLIFEDGEHVTLSDVKYIDSELFCGMFDDGFV